MNIFSNQYILQGIYWGTIPFYIVNGIVSLITGLVNNGSTAEEYNKIIYNSRYDVYLYEYIKNTMSDGQIYYTGKKTYLAMDLTFDEVLQNYPQVNYARGPVPESLYAYDYKILMPSYDKIINFAYSYFKSLNFFVYPLTDIDILVFLFNLGYAAHWNGSAAGFSAADLYKATIDQVLLKNTYGYQMIFDSNSISVYYNRSIEIPESDGGYSAIWKNAIHDVYANYGKWLLSAPLKAYHDRQSEIIAYGTEQALRNDSEANDLKNALALQVDAEKYRLQQEINTADAAMQTELRSAERDFNAMVVNAALLAGING